MKTVLYLMIGGGFVVALVSPKGSAGVIIGVILVCIGALWSIFAAGGQAVKRRLR